MTLKNEIQARDSPDNSPNNYLTAEALSNILDKANERLRRHQDWLADYTQTSQIPTSSPSKIETTTTAPYVFPRQTVLPECSEISVTAFNAGANSASSVMSISLASVSSTASVTIISLSDMLARVESSASVAVSSATSSLFAAQNSMNNAVYMAEKSASEMVASAAKMVASANAEAERAKANATAALRDAENRISSANQAAQARILASQTAAMNNTKFALALTFSILGSSILTVILFYSTIRWRKHRREKRQAELKQKIHLRNTSPSPSLSSGLEVPIHQFPPVPRAPPVPRNPPIPQDPPPPSDPTLPTPPAPPMPSVPSNSLDTGDTRGQTPLEEVPPLRTAFRPVSRHKRETNQRNDSDSDSEIFGMPQRAMQESGKNIEPPVYMSRNEELKQDEGTFRVTNSTNRYSLALSHKPTLQYDPERPRDPPVWLDNGLDNESFDTEIPPPPKSQNRITKTRENLIGAAI
ncbi:hypothetical protein K3495_g4053 [Podosphaera aphanis]|nr:hypothetical protein K3495_g4053 [Podosphaera aphanis]